MSATRQALAPSPAQVSKVLADVKALQPTDAMLDAQEAIDELDLRLKDFRSMKPATAALVFGSDAAWRGCLARLGVEIGRRMSAIGAMRRAAGLDPDFSLDEIRRPIAAGTSVAWTGD